MSRFEGEVAAARWRSGVHSVHSLVKPALALVLSVLVFLPLFPSMPSAMLDPSWRMAMNEAWARGFDFARDMVFTYGPYAFVSTAQYHPDTYVPLVLCSLFLGTVLFLLLRYIGFGSKAAFHVPFILLCLIASKYTSSPDVRFLCYPFLLLVAVAREPTDEKAEAARSSLLRTPVVLSLAGFSLGLVCLVKASYAVEIGAMGGLSLIALHLTGRRILAVTILASFAAGLLLFWLAAGQPVVDLPRFFLAQAQVATGYGQAMSNGEALLPPALFLAAAVPLAIAVRRELQQPTVGRYTVAIGLAVTLFLGFKEGFVREDDWHVLIAAELLFILPWCWPSDRAGIWHKLHSVMAAVTVLVFSVMFPYALDLPGKIGELQQFLHCSDEGPLVCPLRANWLRQTYDLSLARIRAQEPLPNVRGTVDVYTVSQALAIANGYRWDPRPVMQSYSAYTPALARMNVAHLMGANAPDDVFFALEPTDGRLPSLVDGPSWPILLTQYSVEWLGVPAAPSTVAPIALLQRKPGSQAIAVAAIPLLQGTVALGQKVGLPRSDEVLYAKIDIRPNAYGRFEEVLFRASVLYINLLFPGGRLERYRFVPGMARSGFIIAPVVTDATQFVALRDLKVRQGLSARRPVAFWLSGAASARLMWGQATIEISRLAEMHH